MVQGDKCREADLVVSIEPNYGAGSYQCRQKHILQQRKNSLKPSNQFFQLTLSLVEEKYKLIWFKFYLRILKLSYRHKNKNDIFAPWHVDIRLSWHQFRQRRKLT